MGSLLINLMIYYDSIAHQPFGDLVVVSLVDRSIIAVERRAAASALVNNQTEFASARYFCTESETMPPRQLRRCASNMNIGAKFSGGRVLDWTRELDDLSSTEKN